MGRGGGGSEESWKRGAEAGQNLASDGWIQVICLCARVNWKGPETFLVGGWFNAVNLKHEQKMLGILSRSGRICGKGI